MRKIVFLLLITFSFSYELKQFVTCKNVKNLIPTQITNTFNVSDDRVYAFAYFKNIKENKKIDFVWEKDVNGSWKLYADIKLPIYKGYRWRTYSYITIRNFFIGKWRVSLVDGNKTIDKKIFYIKN